MTTGTNNATPANNDDLVSHGGACPNCGERRQDELVWDDAGEEVTCGSCGCCYEPVSDHPLDAEGERPADDDDLVSPEHACPQCGERRVDYLLIEEETETIRCCACGEVYDPAAADHANLQGRPADPHRRAYADDELTMTAGQLRAALEGLPDNAPVRARLSRPNNPAGDQTLDVTATERGDDRWPSLMIELTA